ncbi:hypothetical protein FHX42_003628 [Saccharopolyspora lacisalsi]|uniref:Uncharacterized protein n=1 Tax=Halosaccharopolyspora lacisalsi TaxID=1000566 RepID=A0A839DWB4_9PSEU|nr:hypothetical protein [Halosaccharopolyspora lacisalsi]
MLLRIAVITASLALGIWLWHAAIRETQRAQ